MEIYGCLKNHGIGMAENILGYHLRQRMGLIQKLDVTSIFILLLAPINRKKDFLDKTGQMRIFLGIELQQFFSAC